MAFSAPASRIRRVKGENRANNRCSAPAAPFRRGPHVDQCDCFFRRRSDGDAVECRKLVRVDIINVSDLVGFGDLI
ncbi:hypothetical protein, partial [Pseudomonas sp. MPR-R2A5]|uniref:hypothetical protein n=1 Tax=Pseudomonas sp. MPR-R2A5 TaxID=2070622 RepID=UPI001C46B455